MQVNQTFELLVPVHDAEMGDLVQFHDTEGFRGGLLFLHRFWRERHDLLDMKVVNGLAFKEGSSKVAVGQDAVEPPVFVHDHNMSRQTPMLRMNLKKPAKRAGQGRSRASGR